MKNLLIAEKDQQAENIADALGLTETSTEILVPSKEYEQLQKKIITPKRLLAKIHQEITAMEADYRGKGKFEELKAVKKYGTLKAKFEKYTEKVNEFQAKIDSFANGKKPVPMRYWEGDYNGDEIILVSATGHLLGIALSSKSDDMNAEEEEDEGEDTSEDTESDEEDQEGDENEDSNGSELNFYTKIKAPSPFKEAELNRWLKLQLIEFFVKDMADIAKIICATDFDREGQVIFGLLMEYFNIDLTNSTLIRRMKFSTLEEDVIQEAYRNLIDFDTNLYDAGKMRLWSDYVIGFNLNPAVSNIYREIVSKYLGEKEIDEEIIKKVKYGISFNMGRVKLVILKHIFDKTEEHVQNASKFGKEKMEVEEEINYMLSIRDDPKKSDVDLISANEFIEKNIVAKGFDFTIPDSLDFNVKINQIEKEEVEIALEHVEIPSLLNLTKVFQICEHLGASTEEINTVLEYLYLQKYISYPRSKSEKWEIDDTTDRMKYAQSVLEALEHIGYPIKDYYHNTFGNEGDQSHSHPCIHPLPSITPEKIEILKKMNPLAHLVFNEIAIYILKCFEKLPIVKQQTINFDFIDNKTNTIILNASVKKKIAIIKPNILTFDGYNSFWDFSPEPQLTIGSLYKVNIKKDIRKRIDVDSIRERAEFITDFDIVNFLNENDIGTDATRAVILKDLIEKQYIVSNKVLLTTFLGNQMHSVADHYVKFIDIDYTLAMEKDLNEIEKGEMEKTTFMEQIKQVLIETCEAMEADPAYFSELFEEYPDCENHAMKMVLSNGKFGKFMVCPHFYMADGCKKKFSI
jgi:DNA topoisomerase-3